MKKNEWVSKILLEDRNSRGIENRIDDPTRKLYVKYIKIYEISFSFFVNLRDYEL